MLVVINTFHNELHDPVSMEVKSGTLCQPVACTYEEITRSTLPNERGHILLVEEVRC